MELFQGTLDLLILRTLPSGENSWARHRKAHPADLPEDLLLVEAGSLYPALHRLEARAPGYKMAGEMASSRSLRLALLAGSVLAAFGQGTMTSPSFEVASVKASDPTTTIFP